ncbi:MULTISPECIES: hypothetical protein [unclassified Streptomyces]|uniref:hypothetical protein n=1 Tax=unclassified Streptomyces TaxID=2593676 RepID=UPI000DAC9B97|nr:MULTISPECIES: hypothetical protein [unclassified Streptomyces]PZT72316.1 hypothetical protein DNK55_27575 [Streptomyces sp. AC1-42T]PZT81361.1 hypothetical protein DNK56_03990 [Streptomyces sp. AC1-42W]
MISYTGTLFNDGPVRRVLETAVRARESQGALDLDDEIRRFVRTSGATDVSRWLLPVVAVAALLDHTADLLRSEGAAFFPREFNERLDKARDSVPGEDFLRMLAGRVRTADQEPDAEFDELPLAQWEAAARFPELFGFGANWIYGGEFPLPTDSIAAFIEAEHPFCGEAFFRLAADAQAVLVLFPEPSALSSNVLRWIPWASHDALRQITRSIEGHMRAEHSGP